MDVYLQVSKSYHSLVTTDEKTARETARQHEKTATIIKTVADRDENGDPTTVYYTVSWKK